MYLDNSKIRKGEKMINPANNKIMTNRYKIIEVFERLYKGFRLHNDPVYKRETCEYVYETETADDAKERFIGSKNCAQTAKVYEWDDSCFKIQKFYGTDGWITLLPGMEDNPNRR